MKTRPSVGGNTDCVYSVDETHKYYAVSNRKVCLEKIDIDVNSYEFKVVGIPILMGGMQAKFQYRPVMQ